MEEHHIDIYCERLGPGLWAEPINAVTNLAFIAAGVLLTRSLLRSPADVRRDAAAWTLVALVFAIGIGSSLFHTFATRWAALSDIIPIALFILFYTYLALTRFAAAPIWAGLLAVVAVLALAQAALGAYGAALTAMLAIGWYLRFNRQHPAGNALLTAAGVFALSLFLRTIDEPLCETIPMGTHFFWHLLNAVVLYLVTRAMIRFGQRPKLAVAGSGA